MSEFTYNGIELKFIKTNHVIRTPRYSDDRTQVLWTDFIIDINAVYSPGATAYPDPDSMPETTDTTIRFLLTQPRRPLYYAEGGIPIVELDSNISDGGAIDADNGPTPLDLNITRIAGSSLIFIKYSIKVSLLECPSGQTPIAVASSRYSRTETLDSQYRSTVITNVKAYFNSSVLAELETNADDYRAYLIPRPFLFYKRKQILANLEPNGTYMEFTAIDEEQFISLGDSSQAGSAGSIGITDMDMSYTVNLNPQGGLGKVGMMASATVEAIAVGTRQADTFAMLQFLYLCAYNKFQGKGQQDLTQLGYMVSAIAKEKIFTNEVSISLTFMYVPINPTILPSMTMAIRGYFGIPLAQLPQGNGLNPQPPYGNGTRGLTPIQLAASALATSCQTTIDQLSEDSTGAVPTDYQVENGLQQTSPQTAVYYSPNVQPNEIYVQQSKSEARGPNQQNGYISYAIKSEYDTDYGIIQLPTASNPDSNATNTSTNIQLFKPMTAKKVYFSIERVGAVPETPSPSVTGSLSSVYTLLRKKVTPVGLEIMPDGYTPMYRISGIYEYSISQPILDTDPIPFDIPAWVNYPVSEYTQLISTDYEDGIINNSVTGWPPSSGSGGTGG